MKLKIKLLTPFLILALGASAAAQTKMPPETHNAALRYWMAFAEMEDIGADTATANLINRILSGESSWDEAKLGHLIDDNLEALSIMQRATKLPDCDWGLEYSLGPSTPISFVKNSARALARLNTLYGIRLAANGETRKAIDAWLAGIQFSRHLAQGQSLLGTLVASQALQSNLSAMARAAQSHSFNDSQKMQIETELRALPETGFDWGRAMWYEDVPLQVTIRDMKNAPSAAAYYQEMMGSPAPANFTIPNADEVVAFHNLMAAVEAALRLPPNQAQDKLKTLQDSVKTLHPFFQATMPNFQRINGVRTQVQSSRQALLQVLSEK